eukprot:1134220-Pelagomonas_calceolata.AAC.1
MAMHPSLILVLHSLSACVAGASWRQHDLVSAHPLPSLRLSARRGKGGMRKRGAGAILWLLSAIPIHVAGRVLVAWGCGLPDKLHSQPVIALGALKDKTCRTRLCWMDKQHGWVARLKTLVSHHEIERTFCWPGFQRRVPQQSSTRDEQHWRAA